MKKLEKKLRNTRHTFEAYHCSCSDCQSHCNYSCSVQCNTGGAPNYAPNSAIYTNMQNGGYLSATSYPH